MAEAMGDTDFARQCQEWIEQGSAVMEEHAWAGTHYLLFHELETGKKSDIVMGCQLDGEWMARFHGLEGVFQPDRVKTTLQTIARTSVALTQAGAVVFCKPTVTTLGKDDWNPGYWGPKGVHPPSVFILGMTYIYHGQKEFGLEVVRRCLQDILSRGWCWESPVVIDAAEYPRIGFDYYQDMMLWSVPAALEGGDLAAPCRPGGLVDRVIQAGKA